MHMDDAYFTSDQVTFPYEVKQIFIKILYVLNFQDNPHHFSLERIFEYRYLQSSVNSFPVKYMFNTLGFLWIHHNSPQYMIYLLEQLQLQCSSKSIFMESPKCKVGEAPIAVGEVSVVTPKVVFVAMDTEVKVEAIIPSTSM